MAQPMQVTDITSSFATTERLQNDNNLSNNQVLVQKKEEKEEMDVVLVQDICDNEAESSKNNHVQTSKLHNVSSFEKTFSWFITFTKVACSSVGKKNFQLLERLLSIYIQNISTSMEANYIMTHEMIKLKKHVFNTLTFFHFYWYDIKEYVSDHSCYLNKMSMLLRIYIDMELKISKRSKDPSKIAAKLLTALWVYLNDSEEHIFKVLLRTKLITKRYAKICDLIFIKSFISLKTNTKSMTDMQYVRYLLISKLWKTMKDDSEEQKKIDELAITALGPCMPEMNADLLKFIPVPPAGHENKTMWLLQSNLFDLKQAYEQFMMIEDNKAISSEMSSKKTVFKTPDDKNVQESLTCAKENDSQEIHLVNNTRNTTYINHLEKIQKIKKKCKPVPKLKSEEIIVIDFTKEDDVVLPESKKKKKKYNKKVKWLKFMTKKSKPDKVNTVRAEQQIEIADAHSTENIERCMSNVVSTKVQTNDKDKTNIKKTISCNEGHSPNNISYIDPKKEHDFNERNGIKCNLQPELCDFCGSCLKTEGTPFTRALLLSALLKFIGQNIQDPLVLLDILRGTKEENLVTLKNASMNEKESAALSSKARQNDFKKLQCTVQQLPTSTNHYPTQNISTCLNEFTDKCNSISLLNNMKSSKIYNPETIEIIKQKLSQATNMNSNLQKQVDGKSVSQNYSDTSKSKATGSEDSINNAEYNILNDLNRVMHVLNRISKHVMTVHAEKSQEKCSGKTDTCAVSTTVEDKVTETSNCCEQQDIKTFTAEELYKILEMYKEKNDIKEKNEPNFQEFPAIVNRTEYDCEGYKQNNMLIPNTDETYFKKHDLQSTLAQCKLLQNVGVVDIKSEVDKTVDCYDMNNFVESTKHIHTLKLKDPEQLLDRAQKCTSLVKDCSKSSNDDLIKIDSLNVFENVDILDTILDTALDGESLDGMNNVDNIENMITQDKENSSFTNLIDHDAFPNILNNSEETINPCLIKTNAENKVVLPVNSNECNLKPDTEEFNISSITKGEQGNNNQKDSTGRCVDIVAFGLNAMEQEDFDLFPLDDSSRSISLLKNIPFSSRLSPLLMVNPDSRSSDLRESLAKSTFTNSVYEQFNNDTRMEEIFNDFQREDSVKEQSINDIVTHALNETCTSKEDSSNTLVNNSLVSSGDLSAMSYTSISPLQLELESFPTEELTETPNLTSIVSQPDNLASRYIFTDCQNLRPQQFMNASQAVQGTESSERIQYTVQNDKQLLATQFKSTTEITGIEYAQYFGQEQGVYQHPLQYSNLTPQHYGWTYSDQRNASSAALSSVRVTYGQETLNKVMDNSNSSLRKLEIEELNTTLSQKKRILINLQGKPIPNIIFKSSSENKDNLFIMKEDMSNDAKVLYKIESKGNILISAEKPCLKLAKGTDVKSTTQNYIVPVIRDKNVKELSNEMLQKPEEMCLPTNNAEPESFKFGIPETRRPNLTSYYEESSVKRRKITPKVLTLLEAGSVISPRNTIQGQYLFSKGKDFAYTGNTKPIVNDSMESKPT